MRNLYRITLLVALFAVSKFSSAQVNVSGGTTGVGSYPTLTAAVAAVNGGGALTGAVVIDVPAGFTETLTGTIILGNATINPSLSIFNTITIQKNGAGANPLLTAYTGIALASGGAALDGMVALNGADWVTIDGIDLVEAGLNNNDTKRMEYGYGLFKLSTTDGCQNVTIKNCTITLTRSNITAGLATSSADGSCGIWSSNTLVTNNAALVVSVASGANSNNKFYSNTIQNCNTGIYLIGSTTVSGYDQSNDIGGVGFGTGNSILNYGGGAAAAVASVGIRAAGQNLFNISYNTINNNNGSGVNHTNTLRGILTANSTSANGTIDHNTITLTSAGTTFATTGIDNGAGTTAAGNTINITFNTIGITNNSATSGNLIGINSSTAGTTLNVNNNTINNISSTTATTATLVGFTTTASPTTLNINNNSVSNISCSNAGFTGTITGLRSLGAPATNNFQGNTVSNLSATGVAAAVYGINNTGSNVGDISTNTVFTISSASLTVAGIFQQAGSTVNIYKNKVYDISSTSAGAPTASGLLLATGTTVTIYNNIIGDIKAGSATAANAAIGINVAATLGTWNIYHNTVFLNGTSSSLTFGSSALFVNTSSPSPITVINNLLVNNGTPKGAGNFTVAYRRSSNATGNYGATSDNNLFYSANSVDYSDGTTNTSVLPFIAGRDAASIVTENPQPEFLSIVGSSAQYLHFTTTPATATFIESGGKTVASVTDDIDGESRPGPTVVFGGGSNPDIGADEFDGTPKSMVISAFAAVPATGQCAATSHAITATVIPPASGTVSTVKVWYKDNGGAWTSITLTNLGGNNWGSASIPAAIPTNAIVSWYIEATDNLGNVKTKSGTAYQDDYLNGVTGTFTPASPGVCAGSSKAITLQMTGPSNCTVGAGAVNSSGSSAPASPYYNIAGGHRVQYLYRLADLCITSGTINSIAFDVVNGGTTYQNFTIKMLNLGAGVTTLAAFQGGATTVYSSASETPSIGINTYYITGGFNYTGGALLVEVCWANAGAGATATVKCDNIANISVYQASASGCAGAAPTGLSFRPKTIFNGQIANLNGLFSSFTWSPAPSSGQGTSSVVVAPAGNQTYTVTAQTASGCSVAPTVNVAVNALPAAPTANNNSKCPGVPNNTTVTSTSGLGSPQFIWYNALSGGSVVQAASTLNYYNASIASTTTFYVTEINPVTGCESSPRIPVTATIIAPDAVTAVASATTLCSGANLTLTANKAAGPNVYTYTWTASPAANSGIPVSVGGSPVIVVPTATGTYTYTVSAVDGSCNTSSNVVVNVVPPPTITSVTSSASPICPSSVVNLTTNYTTTGTPIFSEDFNGAAAGWTTVNNSAGGTPANAPWTLRPDGYVYAGTWHSNDNSQFYLTNSDAQGGSGTLTETILTSPSITIPNTFTAAEVSFYEFFRNWPFAWSGGPEAFVEISPDNGVTWASPPNPPSGANLLYSENTTQGAFAGFVQKRFDISSHIGQTIKIRFHYYTVFGWFWGIDNFLVSGYNNTTFSWTSSPVGFTSTQQNPTNVAPPSTTTYTIAVNSNGCSATGNVTVTVLSGPAAPTGFSTVQCGCHVPTATVVSNSGTPPGNVMFDWYDAPSGGNLLQDGASHIGVNSYLGTLCGTKTFYVSENNGSCAGTRTAVTVTVNPPPALTLTPGASTSVCLGSVANLSVSSPSSYSYTWSATPLSGSGMGGSVISASNPVTPTAVGAYQYAINAQGVGANSACINVDTITVVVNPVPNAPALAPTLSNLCPGQVATITATNASTNTYNFGVQEFFNGISNNSTDFPAPYTIWWAGQRMQFLIRASELSGAGFVANSNINSIQFAVSSMGANWGVSTFSCINFISYIGHAATINGSMPNTFVNNAGWSNTGAAGYTPTLGWSTPVHTFSVGGPLVWDGIHDIIIETTFSNGASGYIGQGGDVVVQPSTSTPYQSCIVYRRDAQTPATVASQTTPTYLYTRRPDFRLVGTTTFPITWGPVAGLYTDAAATISYIAGTPLNTIYAAPTSNTIYNAVSTNSYTCTASSPNSTVNISYTPTAATTLAGTVGAARTSNMNKLSNSPYLWDNSNCKLIAKLQPGTVSGQVMARVKIENSVQEYNLEPYVQRHFDIEPQVNPGSTTGTVTLYVTQAEMAAFQAYVAANYPARPQAPVNIADPNRFNLVVTQYYSNSTNGTSNAGTYDLNPVNAVLHTNLTGLVITYGTIIPNMWELTFPATFPAAPNAGSGFFIHLVHFDAILPVEWLGINAYHNAGKNYVDWTVTDQDMKQYEVERSADGSTFEKIGTVLSNGNSNTNFTYHFIDAAPLNGRNYYRIKGISNDNRSGYSRVVVVLVSSKGFAISSLYPNPVTTMLNYEVVSGSNTKATIQIVDVTGKQIRASSENFIKGTNRIQTDISNLPQGQYRLQIITVDGYKDVKPFVKL